MADVKISALPVATTPLDGTELVPIVQGGVTEQVTVTNLTAGRTVAAGTVNVDANTASAAVRITQTGAGNALVVEDSTNPDATPFVVDASGNVGIGVAAPAVKLDTAGNQTNRNFGAPHFLTLSRANGTQTSPTSVVTNSNVARVFAQGYDGTSYLNSGGIDFAVEGTITTGAMPGRIVFNTTPSGSSSPAERMRISSAGFTSLTGSFGRGAPVTKTGNFTLADTENWVICNGTGSIIVTFPAASSWTGREVMIKTIAAQTVVSASSNVVPLAGGAAGTAILAASAGAWATLVSDGTNWVIMQA